MFKSEKKLIELKNLVEGAEISLQQARQILDTLVSDVSGRDISNEAKMTGAISAREDGQVIEGIFDGQNMVGPDGKKYSVPANYASKSKMIEGDGLKLTITVDGSFVYKQINPLERERLNGKLVLDEETGDYRVLARGKSYHVLTASITYFKGEVGDSATILVPKDRESNWAAVENVFRIDESESNNFENESASVKSVESVPAENDKPNDQGHDAQNIEIQENNVEEEKEFALPEAPNEFLAPEDKNFENLKNAPESSLGQASDFDEHDELTVKSDHQLASNPSDSQQFLGESHNQPTGGSLNSEQPATFGVNQTINRGQYGPEPPASNLAENTHGPQVDNQGLDSI